jgi:hypothetical protein
MRVKTNWTATSTVTISFAKNDWMVYSKAGAAWADNSYNIAVAGPEDSLLSRDQRHFRLRQAAVRSLRGGRQALA